MKRETLNAVLAARQEKRPMVVVTELQSGSQYLYEPKKPFPLSAVLSEGCEQALSDDRGTQLEIDGKTYFIHPFNSPLRMVIVGAVHITQVLTPLASMTGYDVSVVDPRRAFATLDRFPGISVLTDWPDDALRSLNLDARTAVVTLTHDPKLDDPALEVALRSPAFYIGSLGSRKTHAARLQRLQKYGLDELGRSRIHGPVGLAIGAKSPAEIAIAILSQVTKILRETPQSLVTQGTTDRKES